MSSEERAIDAALRRAAARARAELRAGLISLSECAAVTRSVRETIGGA